MFPDREWEVIYGASHVAAYGEGLYMDLLWNDQSVEKLVETLRGGHGSPVEEAIECLEDWITYID